jgi:hypothetical protein
LFEICHVALCSSKLKNSFKVPHSLTPGQREFCFVSRRPPCRQSPPQHYIPPIHPHLKALLHSGDSAFHTYAAAATFESKSSNTFVLPAIPAAPLTPITALPQEPPQPELTVLPEATESSALLCSDMSKSEELVSAGGSA